MEWGVFEVGEWLASINLAQHVSEFKDHGIDGGILAAGLDDKLLRACGVGLPIHRKKIVAELSLLL